MRAGLLSCRPTIYRFGSLWSSEGHYLEKLCSVLPVQPENVPPLSTPPSPFSDLEGFWVQSRPSNVPNCSERFISSIFKLTRTVSGTSGLVFIPSPASLSMFSSGGCRSGCSLSNGFSCSHFVAGPELSRQFDSLLFSPLTVTRHQQPPPRLIILVGVSVSHSRRGTKPIQAAAPVEAFRASCYFF